MSDVLDVVTTPRELGTWDCGRPGPTLIVLGGVHGNEHAGVHAAQQLLARLAELELEIAGRVVALRGNVTALAASRRFIDRDLNRGWDAASVAAMFDRIAAAEAAGAEPLAEDREQRDLIAHFDKLLKTASGPVVVLDLHTSSASGAPFLCLADTIDNRHLGLATGVPIILGIEETLEGASLEWFADRGIMGLAVEGGQHEDPGSINRHEAAVWRTLDYLGMLAPAQRNGTAPDLAPFVDLLAAAVGATPPVVEIISRHAITPADDFEMRPGFVNFQPIEKGAVLARDRTGEIRAPVRALVMLPLYQPQGDDGFFLARPVRRFWLRVAAALRWFRCDRLVTVLPGVRRDPEDRNTILVNRGIARWLVTEIFHLLGFRKRRVRDGQLTFTRRLSRSENGRFSRS